MLQIKKLNLTHKKDLRVILEYTLNSEYLQN